MSLSGEKVGDYVIAEVRGAYQFTRFLFDNGAFYTIADLGKSKEKLIVQERP